MPVPDLEILLPVHNEAESIEATVREIYNQISPKLRIDFIICEDGSKDNTREVLTDLSRQLPMRLNIERGPQGLFSGSSRGNAHAGS